MLEFHGLLYRLVIAQVLCRCVFLVFIRWAAFPFFGLSVVCGGSFILGSVIWGYDLISKVLDPLISLWRLIRQWGRIVHGAKDWSASPFKQGPSANSSMLYFSESHRRVRHDYFLEVHNPRSRQEAVSLRLTFKLINHCLETGWCTTWRVAPFLMAWLLFWLHELCSRWSTQVHEYS